MKHSFKPGDWIAKNRVLNDEQFRAVQAVCGESEILQNLERFSNSWIMLGGRIEGLEKEYTLSECLFNDAPDWAVDLRYSDNQYIWTNGDNKYLFIDNDEREPGYFAGIEFHYKHIATRDPIPEPAHVENDDWFNAEKIWCFPAVGAACEVLDERLLNPEWIKCKIDFSGKNLVVYSTACTFEVPSLERECQFRPLDQKKANDRHDWILKARSFISAKNKPSEYEKVMDIHDAFMSGELECPGKQD